MNSTIRALVWEQVWKNRVVFPTLLFLFGVAAGLVYALAQAPPEVWWAGHARGAAAVAFVISLVLSFAPFTLMESHHGWRMNSMVTRWFVLPVRTSVLVLVPLVVAGLCVAVLVEVWTPILHRVIAGLDTTYLLVALLLGLAAMQALAWLLPRRPSQYWPLVGVLLPALFMLITIPPATLNWDSQRTAMISRLAALIPICAVVGWYAARRNRCGDWSGEIPLAWVGRMLLGDQPHRPQVRSPAAALFWWDTFSLARAFFLTWLAFAGLVVGSQCLVFYLRRPELGFNLKLIALVGLHVLPLAGVLWLAAGGLFLGCEPGAGFKTRWSGLRATLPVSAGTLAAQRITAAFLLWLLLWLPLVGLLRWYDLDLSGATKPAAAREFAAGLALCLAVSANVLIGALPVFLWGRLEGFPNMLLAAIVSWAVPWVLYSAMKPDPDAGKWVMITSWVLASAWLAMKVGVAAWALARAAQAGHVTWRYAAGLCGGWLAVVGLLVWGLPTWQVGGAQQALLIVLVVPLARLALCPLAVAANRHR